jgi:hypothetical protein
LRLALVIDRIVDVADVPRVKLVRILRKRRLGAVGGFFTDRLVLAAFILDDAVVLLRHDVLPVWEDNGRHARRVPAREPVRERKEN